MTSIEKSAIVHQCHERLVILLEGKKMLGYGFFGTIVCRVPSGAILG